MRGRPRARQRRPRPWACFYESKAEKGARWIRKVQAALPEGMRLEAVAVDKAELPAQAIEDLLGRGVDVVWTSSDASVYNVATVRSLLRSAIRCRVPVFGDAKGEEG